MCFLLFPSDSCHLPPFGSIKRSTILSRTKQIHSRTMVETKWSAIRWMSIFRTKNPSICESSVRLWKEDVCWKEVRRDRIEHNSCQSECAFFFVLLLFIYENVENCFCCRFSESMKLVIVGNWSTKSILRIFLNHRWISNWRSERSKL